MIMRRSTVFPAFPLIFFGSFPTLLYYYNIIAPQLSTVNNNLATDYDFIVVGSGSGGSVVAGRLSEDPKVRVLLLEAGGGEILKSEIPAYCNDLQLSAVDWQYKTVPQKNACFGLKNKQSLWPRGKLLGGCSSINYMIYVRGNRRDYDRWASLGNYGWNWDQVLPYFLKSENNTSPWVAADTKHHRSGGPLTVSEIPFKTQLLNAFLKASATLGYPTRDIHGEFQTGATPVMSNTVRGSRCSAAKAFLRPYVNRPNLHIMMDSMVLKVLINGTRHAYGVTFERYGKKFLATASKEVILSAGTINTPQLLMLSGIGPKNHLKEFQIPVIYDSPGVGQNLQDHVYSSGFVWVTSLPVSLIRNRIDTMSFLPKYAFEWLFYGIGPLTTLGGVEGLAFVKTPSANQNDDWPDIQFHFASGSVVADGGKVLRHAFGFSDETWNKYYSPFINKDSMSIMPVLLRPRSRGEIRLRSSNPYDHPLIDPNYLSHPADVRVLSEAAKIAIAVGNSSHFQDLGMHFVPTITPGCEHVSAHTNEYWKCMARHQTSTLFHPVGTAKMGPRSDPMAVVDPELRVYGVRGLRVADGSIMPYIVSGNTNAPIIMIGEKVSDLIKKSWNMKVTNFY